MKKILMMCVVALFAIACGDKEPMIEKPDVLTVKQSGETVYTDNEVTWRIVPSVATVTPALYDLHMDGTRFVEAMPMLDMEVLNLANQHVKPAEHFLHEAESVVPSIMGNPLPRYTLTNFRCEVTNWEVLKVSFTCVGYDVTYVKNLY